MKQSEILQPEAHQGKGKCGINRREFLLYSGTAVAATTVMLNIPGTAQAQEARLAQYPKKLIGKLSQLKQDEPVYFNYPDDGLNAGAMLIRLGEKAGGGLSKKQDIVAFSSYCTHQGGALAGTYNKQYKTMGQCPLHLTTYDLTRYGIVVSGQAYQSLPQVVLELDGDDIYAVGVMGLLFGRNDNLIG
ncbi:MAG: arsenate reductase (azurin) small subunit [SAR324 cluster bacterium]|uniref:Arsenate reductase (Azurin) small subunit n=1 Tax=SAR324 cluster bacterium TaxID=2024889 RepID=A0A2A4T726_9DELT|nr:MAG: arsenate reductase (azurin) small subunit [SAR324 cluster bacterium]